MGGARRKHRDSPTPTGIQECIGGSNYAMGDAGLCLAEIKNQIDAR